MSPVSRLLLVACACLAVAGCRDCGSSTAPADDVGASDIGETGVSDAMSRPWDDDQHVSVDPTPYATGCEGHGDCVLASDGWECGCGGACSSTPVLESERNAYLAALESDQAACNPDAACDAGGPDCNDELTAQAACVDSVCVLVRDHECFDAAECADVRAWVDPDAVECVDFTCQECDGDRYWDPGGCPEGYFCRVEHCEPLEECTTADECDSERAGQDRLGCRDGYCRPCQESADCGPDHVCATPRSQMEPGCWRETSVLDEECLNGTCPRRCRRLSSGWTC